jgi:hypothetical protein
MTRKGLLTLGVAGPLLLGFALVRPDFAEETKGLVVSDSEAAQIKAGYVGFEYIPIACGRPPACGGQMGYGADWPGEGRGIDQFPCGGNCGVRWQGVQVPPQG